MSPFYHPAHGEVWIEGRLKALLHDREVLLKEIHHRVKNNLQIVSSLLFLQGSDMENAEARDALLASRSLVQTMAMPHEHLHRPTGPSSIRADEYIDRLVKFLAR